MASVRFSRRANRHGPLLSTGGVLRSSGLRASLPLNLLQAKGVGSGAVKDRARRRPPSGVVAVKSKSEIGAIDFSDERKRRKALTLVLDGRGGCFGGERFFLASAVRPGRLGGACGAGSRLETLSGFEGAGSKVNAEQGRGVG